MTAVIAAFQAEGKTIQQPLKKNSNATSNTIVSHNISFDKFDPKEKEFSGCYECFENYLDSCGVVKPEPNNDVEEEETEDQDKEKNSSMKTILLGCLQQTEFLELKAEIGNCKIADILFPEVVKLLRNRVGSIHCRSQSFCSF